MGNYKTEFSASQLQYAREADLLAYFERMNGVRYKRINCRTGSEYHIYGYGGLYVNTDKGCWRHFSTKTGGYNAVDCLKTVLGMDFKQAMQSLVGSGDVELIPKRERQITKSRTENKEKTVFIKPVNSKKINRLYAFLCGTRGIDNKLVSKLIRQGKIYQDTYGNVVFIHQDADGYLIGAELQGTVKAIVNKKTGELERFQAVATGTRDTVFEIDLCEENTLPKTVYVFESGIDLLSFLQIYKEDRGFDSFKNCTLVSMAGLKPEALKPFIKNGAEIVSCVDSDEHGRKFNRDNGFKDAEWLILEGVKDWNDLLLKRNTGSGVEAVV